MNRIYSLKSRVWDGALIYCHDCCFLTVARGGVDPIPTPCWYSNPFKAETGSRSEERRAAGQRYC